MTDSNSPEEVTKRVIARVESIVHQQNAGTLDLSLLDYFEWRLLEIYRAAEREQEIVHKLRIRAVVESMAK